MVCIKKNKTKKKKKKKKKKKNRVTLGDSGTKDVEAIYESKAVPSEHT